MEEHSICRFRMLGIACAVLAAATLAGCPGVRLDGFVLFIHNDSADKGSGTAITSIEIQGPGDSDFGPDLLEGDLQPGQSIDFVLDAPFSFEDLNGVSYRVRVTYEGFLGFDGQDVATFSCMHRLERTDWSWFPGADIDNRCVF